MIANTLRKARAALDAGDGQRARDLAGAVLERFPGNAEARAIVGDVWRREAYALHAAGRFADAAMAFAAAIHARPGDPALHNDLGACLQLVGDLDDAIRAFERAVALGDDPGALENLASALHRRGRGDDSRAAFERLAAHPRARDRGRHRLRAILQVPAIAESEEQIAAMRARLDRELDALLADPPSIDAPEVRHVTPMFLAYHGASNRDLHTKLSRVFRAACPGLAWVAPHCRDYPGASGRRIRVGFASSYLHDHSIGHTTRGFLERIDRARFEAFAIRIPPARADAIAAAIDAASERVVTLPTSLAAMREAIAALELDVLFYQDIGMEPTSYFLAHARLAPVQCTSFGHPDTTGIDTIDAFVSGERIEPEDDPGRDYSELLHRLAGASVLAYYHPPSRPDPLPTRAALGFADADRIYACPQALFKLHPRMDALFARILERDERATIVLIAAGEPAWHEALERRHAALGALARRVRFVPRMRHADYLALLARADVALDSLPFNGMNTTLESFAMGLPVVTLPTRLQRGRHTAGMYAHMGLERYVARDESHYVDLAWRAANDATFRAAWRADIAAQRHRLYRNDDVVHELERWFTSAVDDAARRPTAAG